MIINEAASHWEKVLSGIPQSSVLGPLLFIIYINDLVDACGSDAYIIYLFADDAKIFKHITKLDDKTSLKQNVDKFINWTDRWLVQVNVQKCKVMSFYNRLNLKGKVDEKYRMRDINLENVATLSILVQHLIFKIY